MIDLVFFDTLAINAARVTRIKGEISAGGERCTRVWIAGEKGAVWIGYPAEHGAAKLSQKAETC